MTSRQDYVKQMRAALDQLQVKAGLAKLELREVRDELLKKHDDVRERLHELGEASEQRWDAVKAGFESAWTAFRHRYDEAMHGGSTER